MKEFKTKRGGDKRLNVKDPSIRKMIPEWLWPEVEQLIKERKYEFSKERVILLLEHYPTLTTANFKKLFPDDKDYRKALKIEKKWRKENSRQVDIFELVNEQTEF